MEGGLGEVVEGLKRGGREGWRWLGGREGVWRWWLWGSPVAVGIVGGWTVWRGWRARWGWEQRRVEEGGGIESGEGGKEVEVKEQEQGNEVANLKKEL